MTLAGWIDEFARNARCDEIAREVLLPIALDRPNSIGQGTITGRVWDKDQVAYGSTLEKVMDGLVRIGYVRESRGSEWKLVR